MEGWYTPLREVWVSLVRLRNGWRICLHWSKSPVPLRWSLEGPISSWKSVGKQGSSTGVSAVSPTCWPKSLEKVEIKCNYKDWRGKLHQAALSFTCSAWKCLRWGFFHISVVRHFLQNPGRLTHKHGKRALFDVHHIQDWTLPASSSQLPPDKQKKINLRMTTHLYMW